MHSQQAFPRLQADGGSAGQEVSESAEGIWDAVLSAVPRIGIAVGIAILGWLVSRGVRALLRRALRNRQTPSFARVMSKVGGWVVLAVGLLLAVTVTFPSVKPVDLIAGLGFASVAIGFAFQDILENTLAGILLLFRQPFRSGDQVEVQERRGTVVAITIRETQIKTFDGELVIIPNRDVYKSTLVVQTHYPQRRMAFVVGVAYENDASEATEAITAALAGLDGVSEDPRPEALVKELGSSTVDVEVHFWTNPRQHESLVVLDRAIKAVKRALDEAGIEMPAEIVALQATPSFRAAVQGGARVTPGGGVASG